ncbi:hypothetical protein OTU49_004961 [Cherax quadricarinatus]|uniref:NADH dehydrogenase [ubiquinone] 1 subunit C2 n=1 Tax=Cherax quadricarinatus TaxID=27406 RepID=A0AAW0XE74_CHEQU
MEAEQKTHINPADYFNPDTPVHDRGFLRKLWFPFILGASGFGMACFLNIYNRKPKFSGIQQHVMFSSLGILLGISATRWLAQRAAERDHIYYHYMLAHPDDFPPIGRNMLKS